MFPHGRRDEAIFCCWSGRRKHFCWRFRPICPCSSMISAASQVNCSLILTLEQSITPHCVCTLLKIHNWSCIESMFTVNLHLNKLNKAKSSEDPLVYPMTRRDLLLLTPLSIKSANYTIWSCFMFHLLDNNRTFEQECFECLSREQCSSRSCTSKVQN